MGKIAKTVFLAECYGLFLLLVCRVVFQDGLNDDQYELVVFTLFVLGLGLMVPYLLDWTPPKDWVDLLYYSLGAFVAVSAFIYTAYDRQVLALQHEIAGAESQSKRTALEIRDLDFVAAHRPVVLGRIQDGIAQTRIVLGSLIDQNCQPYRVDLPRSFFDPNSVQNYTEQAEQRRREQLCQTARIQDSALEAAGSGGGDLPATIDRSLAAMDREDIDGHFILGPAEIRYGVPETVKILAMSTETLAAESQQRQLQVQRLAEHVSTLQERQKESLSENNSSTAIALSDFFKTRWPFAAVFLFALKIARVPYLRQIVAMVQRLERRLTSL